MLELLQADDRVSYELLFEQLSFSFHYYTTDDNILTENSHWSEVTITCCNYSRFLLAFAMISTFSLKSSISGHDDSGFQLVSTTKLRLRTVVMLVLPVSSA